MARIRKEEWLVALFTLAYTAAFSYWFLQRGNAEFAIYIATMLGLMALVGVNLRRAEFPPALLWALSIWGLAHMAGGGVPVGDGVLYGVQVIPLTTNGELTLLKFDQLVHAYGFGVTAWLLRHLLLRHYPDTRHGWTGYVYPALASMGLGSVNEMIEFSAVLMVPDTGVGGYYNNALDLVLNATGAVIAMIIARIAAGRG